MTTAVSIVGVSGFSGVELLRLIARRPELAVTSVLSDRWRGERTGAHVSGLPARDAALVVRGQSEALAAAADADVVLLATPAEASAELAPRILALGKRVVDLSGAFRLTDVDSFRAHYGFEHPEPALLGEAHYGLPQVPAAHGAAPPITSARLVANPGCYATAAILPLAPLLAAGLIDPTAIFVDGKSGVTGAGRKLAEAYLFTEVSENMTPYRVAKHQHAPEIELVLARAAGREVSVTFAPHLVPLKRGLIATSFGRLAEGAGPEALETAVADAYGGAASPLGERIVEVTAPEEVSVQAVWCTPKARLGVRGDARRRSFVAVCAIDNLMKGAASQALENLLRMIGKAPG